MSFKSHLKMSKFLIFWQVTYYQLVQAAVRIEKLEGESKERKQEKGFSKGGSISGKRSRESQGSYSAYDSVQSPVTRGRRQGQFSGYRGGGSSISLSRESIPRCPHCLRNHRGTCSFLTKISRKSVLINSSLKILFTN